MSKIIINEKILKRAIKKMSEALDLIKQAGVADVESGHDVCCYGILTEHSMGYGLAIEDLIDGFKEFIGDNS
jgi:hypothetical protein